jgi:hypothetical protein
MADCTYSVPNLDTSGDALYGSRICDQTFIDFFWYSHKFNGTYWQGGWGYDDCCNVTKPLARTFNAMWLLTYSADDYTNQDWGSDILHWGARYVREQFTAYGDLRAMCGDGSAVATTTGCQQARSSTRWGCTASRDERYKTCREWSPIFAWLCFLFVWVWHKVCLVWGWISEVACVIWYGTFGGGENITLYLWFFYPLDGSGNPDVIARAGVLIHEARHAGGRPHDAQFPSGSTYGAGQDGADSSWGYNGAWTYNALYLWWFYAQGTRTTPALREAAKQQANVILMNAFATNPGFLVT